MHADQVGCMNLSRTTQLTLVLGGFLGEDVALERHGALDRAAATRLESLGGAALGLHFWHDGTFLTTLPHQVVEPFHAWYLKSTCLHR